MADTTNPAIDRYTNYYNQVLASLNGSMPTQTDAQLKNYLTKLLRPGYDQAIQQRQMQTGQANAAIDADAASRGMGSSTWVTDAKARQMNSQAADIAGLNQNYNSALYDALLNQINQRDQQRANIASMANSITGNMYGEFKKEDPTRAHSSGGGGGIDAKEYYRSLRPHSSPHRNPGPGNDNGAVDDKYTAPTGTTSSFRKYTPAKQKNSTPTIRAYSPKKK